MRSFRDAVLNKTPEGQELIRLYYQWSPIITKAMEEDEEFKEEVKEMIDGVLPLIRGEELMTGGREQGLEDKQNKKYHLKTKT